MRSSRSRSASVMSRNSIESSSPHGSKCDVKNAERSDRSMSLHSADICRICHCEVGEGKPDSHLIAPCYCSGSLRFVHPECLQLWIKASDIKSCELCHFAFIMHTKTKPFSQWDRLDMSTIERRKVLCSVTFHIVAITCVVWSLYVLIDRTAEEARSNHLEWSFWTKLIVVAVGFTGGIVFMYVQCKTYVHLFKKWRAFNRVICVQNAPEKVLSATVAVDSAPVDQDNCHTGKQISGDCGVPAPAQISAPPPSYSTSQSQTGYEPCHISVVNVHNAADSSDLPKIDIHDRPPAPALVVASSTLLNNSASSAVAAAVKNPAPDVSVDVDADADADADVQTNLTNRRDGEAEVDARSSSSGRSDDDDDSGQAPLCAPQPPV